MHSRIPRSFLCAAAFGAYSLAFAESFVRIVAPQAFVPREIVAAPYGVRMNKPGAVYRQHTPEMSADVRINSEGLRADRDYPVKKPEGVSRVAVFGDSYLLGYEASNADMATARLEEGLRSKNCPAEVLNFAVSGFGTAEMLKTLEARGLDFEPDVVIFQWHHTDPDDNLRANLYRLDNGKLIETGASYVPAIGARTVLESNPVYRKISDQSHLFIAARERASRYVRRMMAGHVFSRKTTSGASSEERVASPVDVAILGRAELDARRAGAAFFVIDIPGVQSRTRFKSSFRQLPPELVARANYISPQAEFEAAASNTEKLYWERGHKHLTPKGNAVLASVMAERIAGDEAAAAALGCKSRSPARLAAAPPE